jgi:hypothetical protein
MATEIFITIFKTVFCFVMLSAVYLAIMVKMNALKSKAKETLSKDYYQYKYALIVHIAENFNWDKLLQSLQNQSYHNFTVLFVVGKGVKIPSAVSLKKFRILERCHLESKLEIMDYVANVVKPDAEAIAYIKGNCTLDKNFINSINVLFNKGFNVAQANIIKADESILSINKSSVRNLVERSNRISAGLSSTICNHGFFIKLQTLKLIDLSPSNFDDDKKLQSSLVLYNNQIGFAENARIIDYNKESKSRKLAFHLKQSVLFAYYYYLGAKILIDGINTQNFDKINFGANYMRPPVVVMTILSAFVIYLTLVIENSFSFFTFTCIITMASMLMLTFSIRTKQSIREYSSVQTV